VYPQVPVVYKLTNTVNGKCYVGSTLCLRTRLKYHRSGFCAQPQHPLYIDIHRYGWSAFSVDVLEECDAETLRERERYYIDLYDSFHSGYNLTPATSPSELISEFNAINWANPEYRKERGAASSALQIKRLENKSYYSEKVEQLKRYTDTLKRIVGMYSLDGELLHTFEGARIAGRWLNDNGITSAKTAGSCVSNICSGKNTHRKTLYGYRWSYITRD